MSGQSIIQIMCPNLICRRILAVPTTTRGKLVRCRGCGSTIRVPGMKATAQEGADDQGDGADGQRVA